MESIVKALIKDNLINTRLVLGLDSLDIDANGYTLSLSDTILQLMNIKLSDAEFEVYDRMFVSIMKIDLLDRKQLNGLINEIYESLIKYEH